MVIATADLQADPQQAELIRALAAAKTTAVNAVADVLLGKTKPQSRPPVGIPGLFGIGAGIV